MCLITYTPNKAILNIEKLRRGYDNNPHGFGVVYAKDDKLEICKVMENFDYFLEVLKLVPEEVPMAIHFRWATQGAKSVENAHPFRITAREAGHAMDLCMMHNGTIPGSIVGHGYINEEKDWSDTRKYVVHHLRPFLQKYPDAIFDPVFIKMVERDVGTGSRLFFLSGDGRHSIVNKLQGCVDKDHDEIWYSNDYSFRENYRSYTSDKKNSGTTGTNTHNVHSVGSHTALGVEYYKDSEVENTKEMPEFLKGLLSPNQKLLKPCKATNPIRGYGWVAEGTILKHNMTVALAHRKWYDKKDTQSNTVVVDITTSPKSSNTSDADLVTKMEKQADERQFRIMNEGEILQWVNTYPAEAAEWMVSNGFYATNLQIIRKLEDQESRFADVCAEFIYKKSKNRNFVLPIEEYLKHNLDVVA